MATIDIREDNTEVIDAIQFSENEQVTNSGRYVELCQKIIGHDDRFMILSKSNIPNLIAALNKAKELGWY